MAEEDTGIGAAVKKKVKNGNKSSTGDSSKEDKDMKRKSRSVKALIDKSMVGSRQPRINVLTDFSEPAEADECST